MAHGGQTEIREGLRASETVVTVGQLRLAPGMAVSIKAAEAGNTDGAAAGGPATDPMR
jgi:hypothetical protein